MAEEINTAYREYLKKRFREISTPSEVISDAVQAATGSPLASSKRLFEGESNEVHDVTTEAGQSIIARISRKDSFGFEREKWAIGQCERAGVSVPKVLRIESTEHRGETLWMCIETKLEGQPLAHLLGQEPEKVLHSLVRSAGDELSKIHSVTTQGYGPLNPSGRGGMATWAEYMLQMERNVEALRGAAWKISLEPKTIDDILNILKRHQDIYTNTPSRLLHGDFDPVHILTRNQEITGILDFESCLSGDPAYDFAWWDLFRGDRLPTDWLMEGYANKEILDKSFSLRLSLIGLRIALGQVEYYARLAGHPGTRILKEHIEKKLEGLKQI